MTDLSLAGRKADELIAAEVAIQDRMWGDANERADATNGQLMHAGFAQLAVLDMELRGELTETAVAIAKNSYYPVDWNGLRCYGSPIANLVVAAAFIRSEIKRRVLAGEDATRTKRGEPYRGNEPYVSSEVAVQQAAETEAKLAFPGGKFIVVLDGELPNGKFIEIENAFGMSRRVGEYTARADGLVSLEIDLVAELSRQAPLTR